MKKRSLKPAVKYQPNLLILLHSKLSMMCNKPRLPQCSKRPAEIRSGVLNSGKHRQKRNAQTTEKIPEDIITLFDNALQQHLSVFILEARKTDGAEYTLPRLSTTLCVGWCVTTGRTVENLISTFSKTEICWLSQNTRCRNEVLEADWTGLPS